MLLIVPCYSSQVHTTAFTYAFKQEHRLVESTLEFIKNHVHLYRRSLPKILVHSRTLTQHGQGQVSVCHFSTKFIYGHPSHADIAKSLFSAEYKTIGQYVEVAGVTNGNEIQRASAR